MAAVIDGSEMRSVDLEVTQELGLVRTMETVGIRTADFVQYQLKHNRSNRILCVAGKGNNGGNAIAIARVLMGRGFDVQVWVPAGASALTGMANEQLELFQAFGGMLCTEGEAAPLVIDGLLGTGITSAPRGVVAEAIACINSWQSGTQVLSCDIPSGVNHVTGEAYTPCVRATWTLNYHVLKSGQLKASSSVIGELWTAETQLTYHRFGPEVQAALIQLYKDGPIARFPNPSPDES